MNSTGLGLRKLGINIFVTIGGHLFSLLFGLATAAIIARTLGPAGNGQYSVALLMPTFLVTFLNLGVSPANVYYVGRHSITPRVAFKASIEIWMILVVFGLGAGAFSIVFYGDQWFPNVSHTVLWIALISFPLGLLQGYLSSLLQAVQDFRRYNLVTITSPAIMLILVYLFLRFGVNVAAVISAFLSVQFIQLAITYLLIRSIITVETNYDADANSQAYTKLAIQYGYKAHLSNILTFINYRVDIFLVNLLINPSATGVYVIAVAMSEKLWLLSNAVSTVLLPRLSELHADEASRRQLTPLIARWIFGITILTGIGLALISSYLIQVIFGKAYLGALMPLLLLLPGIVLATVTKVLANDIAARGRPELNMYTSAIVVLVNILCNLLFIPQLGLSGAALATTIAYFMQFVFLIGMYSWLSKNSWYDILMFNSYDISLLKQMCQRLLGKKAST